MTDKPKRKRTKTRTGKKLDPKTGRIAGAPKVGQILGGEKGKRDGGWITRATDADVREVVETKLPTAGPEKMGVPSQTTRPKQQARIIRSGVAQNPSGFSGNPQQVAELAKQAMGHLERMRGTRGTEEFHSHHESFNAVHATLAHDTNVHTMLGHAYHTVMNPNHPNSEAHYGLITKELRSKISGGLRVAKENVDNAKAGQARARAARIAKEKGEV